MAMPSKASKCISIGETILDSPYIRRGFVTATNPSYEAKVDKETCGKIIEATKTVKDGAKEVVSEVKRVGKATTKKIAMDVVQKGFEKVSQGTDSEGHKDAIDTVKTAAEAFKEKATDK